MRICHSHLAVFAFVIALLSGCANAPQRNPVPEHLHDGAQIPGIPGAREWADVPLEDLRAWFDLPKEELQSLYPLTFGESHHYLAISGGGAKGAFAAGLLNGWTQAETRPDFTIVTGVSTGAIIAPFAFLGPDYDHILEEIYTTLSTRDAATPRSTLRALLGDAAADTTPLRKKLAEYIDEDLVAKIATEFERGRSLVIGTTNLDAGRPVAWNITRIAASGAPNATQLIRDVILASAAVPAALPPVIFTVKADGKQYDEMHIDGGASSHVFFYPVGLDWVEVVDRMDVKGSPNLYVIRNGYLSNAWSAVKPQTLSIARRTMSTLMTNVLIGDIYRVYLAAERDGLNFHLAYMPESFDEESSEPLDPVYMTKLFNLGYELGKNGYQWDRTPPGIDTGNNTSTSQ